MIKKFGIIIITTLALTLNVNAASDGELILKKNDPSEVKDCFEGMSFYQAFLLASAKYVFKIVIALIDTLFIYIARNWKVPE